MLSAVLLAMACREDPCQRYLNATEACYAEAGVEPSVSLSRDFCDDYDESAEEYFACLAQIWEGSSCSTDASVDDIITEMSTCTLE